MLTAEQIDRFHADGLLVVRGVFGDEEIRALQEAADAVTREAVAEAGTGHGYREVDGHKQYYRTDASYGTSTRPSGTPRSTPASSRRSASASAIPSCRSTTRSW